MDKFLFYLTLFGLVVLIIVGGNYFLTDKVGNFSMEKAMNLIPNIEVEIIKKKNEFTGERDINKDMADAKEAERLDIEGPAARSWSRPGYKAIEDFVRDSVTEQYMNEMNAFNDRNSNITSFQKVIMLKEIQDQFLNNKFYWSGIVSDVKEYSNYILLSMRIDGEEYNWNILYCDMPLSDLSRTSLKYIKKEDKVTVTGDYKRSDEDPWIENCEIVDQ